MTGRARRTEERPKSHGHRTVDVDGQRARQGQPAEARGRDRQRVPVAEAQLLLALEQAAVDHQALAVRLERVLRAGYGPGGAKKLQAWASASFRRPQRARR